MPSKSTQPLEKHTLNLFAGDFAALAELYPDINTAVIIRTMVRKLVRKAEAAANAVANPIGDIEIDL